MPQGLIFVNNVVVQIDHCKKNYKFGFGMTVGE